MDKRSKYLLTGLITLIILVPVLNFMIKDNPALTNPKAVCRGNAVNELILSENTIRLGSLDFEWDELFIFSPYSTPDQDFKALGIKKLYNLNGLVMTDGFQILVFVKKNKIVCLVDYNYYDNDIGMIESYNLSTKNHDAILKRVKQKNKNILKLIE